MSCSLLKQGILYNSTFLGRGLYARVSHEGWRVFIFPRKYTRHFPHMRNDRFLPHPHFILYPEGTYNHFLPQHSITKSSIVLTRHVRRMPDVWCLMGQIRSLFEVKLYFPISPEVNIAVLLIKIMFADGIMTCISWSRKLLNDNEESEQDTEQTAESVKDKEFGVPNEPLKQRKYS